MTGIVYACCVGSWEKFDRYVAPRTGGRRVITKFGYTGIARAYNEVLDVVRYWDDVTALVFVHDDLELTDPDAEDKLTVSLRDPGVALVGVAGGQQPTNEHEVLAWWDVSPCVGHQLTDSCMIDFGTRSGEVHTLEGSLIAFSPWAVRHLRFDEGVPGFHGYDVDIGLRARSRGRRVVVADIDTHHHTLVGFRSEEEAVAWRRSNAYVTAKWDVRRVRYVG